MPQINYEIVDDGINISAEFIIEHNKKAIVRCEDGNVFLSFHDGKGWIGTIGQRTNYFAEGYVVEYEHIS
jgi:hypothetical protein